LKIWIWLALTLPGAVLAQEIGRPATIGAPRIPETHSVEQADARLLQVKKDREAVEAEFNASEALCYKKFFVNACIDKAKEQRRLRLAELRSVEVEASHFKRQNAVEVRDRELEDRVQKDAAEAAYNAEHPKPPRPDPASKALPKPAAVSVAQRQAQHDAKERARAGQEAAAAPKRAANAADFERKKAEAEKRQADVKARVAEKEEKRRRAAAAQPAQAKPDAKPEVKP
jgi:colicin import membrane protein